MPTKRTGSRALLHAGNKALLSVIPRTRAGDRLAAFIVFMVHHRRLPTRRPLFNDVFYRIKTSDEILDPLRVFVSDKEYVKLYVKAVVGDRHNVPTIDVLRSRDEVDGYGFPPDCCIKPTQASGQVLLRLGDAPVDREEVKGWFDLNYYRLGREANYRQLRPKVIIEPLIFGTPHVEDYKFFCHQGRPRLIQVDIDRHTAHTRKCFDVDWNELDFSMNYPRSDRHVPRPGHLDEMLRIAAELSRPFSTIRVDLYSDGQEILVGELTHVSSNAGCHFIPPAAEVPASRLIFG